MVGNSCAITYLMSRWSDRRMTSVLHMPSTRAASSSCATMSGVRCQAEKYLSCVVCHRSFLCDVRAIYGIYPSLICMLIYVDVG